MPVYLYSGRTRKRESGEQGLDSGPGAWAMGGQGSQGRRGWTEKGPSGSHTPGANSGSPEQELGPSRKEAPQFILTRQHWARTGPSVLRPQCCHSKHKMMWPSGLTLTELATQQQPLRGCYISGTLCRASGHAERPVVRALENWLFKLSKTGLPPL